MSWRTTMTITRMASTRPTRPIVEGRSLARTSQPRRVTSGTGTLTKSEVALLAAAVLGTLAAWLTQPGALKVTLSDAEKSRIAGRSTKNAEAHDLFLNPSRRHGKEIAPTAQKEPADVWPRWPRSMRPRRALCVWRDRQLERYLK